MTLLYSYSLGKFANRPNMMESGHQPDDSGPLAFLVLPTIYTWLSYHSLMTVDLSLVQIY